MKTINKKPDKNLKLREVNDNYANALREINDKGYSISKAARENNVDRHRLSDIIKEGYVQTDNKCFFNNESFRYINEVISIYKSTPGMTLAHVLKEYGIKGEQFSKYLELFGEKKHDNRLSYDRRKFEVIDTPDKAYWLGFILADGGVFRRELRIKLHEKDRRHLEKFIQFMDGEGSITIKEEIHSTTGNKLVKVVLSSRELVDDLAQYGIVPQKSCKEKPYANLREDLIPHYIRGFFDGDGCISSNLRAISFVGSEDMMKYITKHFVKLGCRSNKIWKEKSYFRCKWQDKDDVKVIIKYLYRFSNKNNRLTRKAKLASTLLKNNK